MMANSGTGEVNFSMFAAVGLDRSKLLSSENLRKGFDTIDVGLSRVRLFPTTLPASQTSAQ